MKKITLCIMTAFLMLSFIPTQVKAANETSTISTVATKTVESADANQQLARLNEIKAMDFSTLSRSEKKELRQEVREIKSNQERYHDRFSEGRHHRGGAVYVSVGGGLLIILLLILLL